MKPLNLITILLLVLVPVCIQAQYRSNRPLEMTFEQADYFFTPTYVNPLGAENFKSATVLTSENPLIAIQRNPANLSDFDRDTLTDSYLYLDFRNNRDIVKKEYPGYYEYNSGYMPGRWGYYHTTSRSELTPLISLAYLTRIPVFNESVTMGATYQLINQAGEYYAIPRDIYRHVAGKDVEGKSYSGTEDYEIEDRYSASDEMYNEGHAVNAFIAWEINNSLELGMKAGRFLFRREGSVGSDNLWNDRIDYYSYWKKHEDRTQDYDHWDLSLGLTWSFNKNSRLGLNAGWLTGDVMQEKKQDDNSISNSGEEGSSHWSNYQSWYTSDQNWDHKGNTFYTGLQWEKQFRDDLSFRFMYNYSGLKQNLGLGSSIRSQSENEYHHENSNRLYESEGYSKMHDFRDGEGKRTISKNVIKSTMKWKVTDNQTLNVGVILGQRKQSTQTSEKVDAFLENYRYYHRISGGENYTSEDYHKSVEDKTIRWNFDSRLRSVQIPVFYQYNISKNFDLLTGINRTMNFWKINNKTLILYDYRERVDNEKTNIEEMTGERIKEPEERISVTKTNFLLGLTFSPTPRFSVRILASPGFEEHSLTDKQLRGTYYWLSMGLRP
jgi:hypothetical protein